jgi:hypothetical protein
MPQLRQSEVPCQAESILMGITAVADEDESRNDFISDGDRHQASTP